MRRLALLAMSVCLVAGPVAAADLTSPEATVAASAAALKANDVVALFATMPASDQAKARAEWTENKDKTTPQQKAEIDEFFANMLASDAVDKMVAEAEPKLADFNPMEAAAGIQMLGGMLAMQLAQNPETKDYAQVAQQLVMDIAGWLPTSGIEKTDKLREACTHVVGAVKALGVTTCAELQGLEFNELLKRSGLAMAEGKKALGVYGLNADAFLGSLKLADVKAVGEKADAKLQFTAFAKPYSLPVKLVNKDGRWMIDEEAIQNAMGPLMGGAGGMMGPPGGDAPEMDNM